MTEVVLMDVITAVCGFVGAWLLVAGPMYQGAVELSEAKIDRSIIQSRAEALPPREPISPWWWLLPPVAYVKISRKENEWRQQVMAAMTPQERLQLVTFGNKATGWFVVGAGASLIAIKETAELVAVLDWPSLVTIPLVVLAAVVALGFTVRRMHQSQYALLASNTTE